MSETDGTYKVRLFAGLELRAAQRRAELELSTAEAATIGALVEHLGLPPAAAGLVLVNGLHAQAGRSLHPGDEVSLFPPLGGG